MTSSQLQLPPEFTTIGSPPSMTYEFVRSHNVGSSDYASHSIQPWDIWIEYKLNPFDADIVKRILRTKTQVGKSVVESRKEDYQKIIHVCQERIRQLESGVDLEACVGNPPPADSPCTASSSSTVSNRELARWIAQGRGELVFAYEGKVLDDSAAVHSYEYEWVDSDKPVPSSVLVRSWAHVDWVPPTRSYLGLK